MDRLLIGGITRFGSGKVIQSLSKDLNCDIFNTSNIRLSGLFKLLWLVYKHDYEVFFAPSMARLSWLRDICILFILLIARREINIILLCDIDYVLPRKINRIIYRRLQYKFKNIYMPAKNHALFDLDLIPLYHPISNPKFGRRKDADFRVIPFYANYLTSDKGLDEFTNFFSEGLIIGENINKLNLSHLYPNYELRITNNKKEFTDQLYNFSNKFLCYYYCSVFDLSPIIIQEIISLELAIVVKRGSKSEEILNGQLFELRYFYSDNLQNVSQEEYQELVSYNHQALKLYASKFDGLRVEI